jgi:hypothetical protein
MTETPELLGDDVSPTPAAADETPAPAPATAPASPSAAAAAAEGRRTTEYVVLYGESFAGPFDVAGRFTTQGQTNAKKEAAKKVGIDDAEKYFFAAVPVSSFRPEKPTITLQITFATDDAADDTADE